jgi:ADP-ribose pyrophosphatase
MTLFLYGTLLHDAVFAQISGPGDGTARRTPARLADHAVDRVDASVLPMLMARPGATASGAVWFGLTDDQRVRLDLYEIAFGYRLVTVEVETEEEGRVTALAYFPPEDQVSSGEPWSLDRWSLTNAAQAVLAAKELDAHDPPLTAAEMYRQWPMLAARAHAAARANANTPVATLRRAPAPGDFYWHPVRPLEGAFFKLAAMEIGHRRFDGSQERGLRREVLVGVDASLVLPYDPVRDRVLVIEQFRSGPLRRGDPNPWTLEPVAGIVDAGETPQEAARRETAEEAGLTVDSVERMFSFYPSPGSSTDYFHCFVALADLPDDHATRGGLAAEAEDIRIHVLSRDAALQLIDNGEITAGPLITMLYWLDRNRTRLAKGVSETALS